MTGCRKIKLMTILGGILLLLSFTNAQIVETGSKGATKEVKPKIVLTGDPQKDYIHDPNLPRQLDGYDLSEYPFYQRVPDVKFNFTCDDRLDGFYASVPHKCQVYHNCLFGVRYDFLCPNYTVFDQTHFICHFVSAVDCPNSEDFYYRNEILYVEAKTTTQAPIIKYIYVDRPLPSRRQHNRPQPNRPRPNHPRPNRPPRPRKRTTTPQPEEALYYDDYYYDDSAVINQPNKQVDDYYANDDVPQRIISPTTSTTARPPNRRPNRPSESRPSGRPSGGNINQRIKPNVKPSIPDYDFEVQQTTERNIATRGPHKIRKVQRRRRKKTTTTTAAPEIEYEYYDYIYYEDASLHQATPAPTTRAPLVRFRRPNQRPTARDRQAQLKTRKEQLLNASVRKPIQPQPTLDVQVEESIAYYDEAPVYNDAQYNAGADYEEQLEPVRSEDSFREVPQEQNVRQPVRRQNQNRRRMQPLRGSKRNDQ